MKTIEGKYDAKGIRIAVIVSRFNGLISERLLTGALNAFAMSGGDEKDVTVVRVPGSFEIPLVARKLASNKKVDGILCLGALIRGSTPHFEYIAAELSKGISRVSLESGIPISFGVVTADNLEQAIERAGAKMGNRGEEATLSLIEMVSVVRSLNAEV